MTPPHKPTTSWRSRIVQHRLVRRRVVFKNTPGIKNAQNPLRPAYSSLHSVFKDAAEIEATWDEVCPKDWRNGETNVKLEMRPKLSQSTTVKRIFRDRLVHPSWRAELLIKARNIPRLLRRGFYWSNANITKGEDRIIPNKKGFLRKLISTHSDCCHKRIYELRDHGPNPEWIGFLDVCSEYSSTIVNFDVNWITKDTVVRATARNWDGNLVYNYAKDKEDCFTTIYSHMPLNGWWPWPDYHDIFLTRDEVLKSKGKGWKAAKKLI